MIKWGMTKGLKYGFLFVLAIIYSLNGQAQEDARLWLRAGIRKKVTQRLDIEFQNCIRLGENYTRLNTFYAQIKAEQELFKGVKLGLAFRQVYRRKVTPEYHSRQRYAVYLELSKNIFPRWEVQYRPMYMRQYTDVFTSENGFIATDYFRHKFALQYKPAKRYSPFVSCELYYRIRYDFNNFNRVRYTVGFDYRFDKHHKTTVFYRIQKRLNEEPPMTAYILNVEYTFIF